MTAANRPRAEVPPGFAVWITGLPASGKSTVTRWLAEKLRRRGVDAAVLESDTLRRILTPDPSYNDQDREAFYRAMVWIGKLLTDHGVGVIFDATANRRAYRDAARREIANFLEVFVDCPLEVCMERDPKGIYRRARAGGAPKVPGLGAVYEAPPSPEISIRADREAPEQGAERILAKLIERAYV